MTRDELDNKMAVLLGGRAAEFVVYGHLSTGAADDLRRVTDIARAMVTRYGMSDKLGGVAYDRDPHTFMNGPDMAPWPQQQENYAETTAATIDSEVHDLVQAAMERALASCATSATFSNAAPANSLKKRRWRRKIWSS